MTATVHDALTSDAFFEGRLEVRQPRDGYRFSIDAVLLASLALPRPGDRVLDLGTGCGIVPLILVFRFAGLRVTGLELQPGLAELARQNVVLNGMSAAIEIREGDLRQLRPGKELAPFDLVVSNPPYRKARAGRVSSGAQRALARHEIAATLADVLGCAERMLQKGGRFVMVYAAERLTDICCEMRRAELEPKRLQVIHSRPGEGAKLLLVEGLKGARPGLAIDPPLFIYDAAGGHSDALAAMLRP
ncbi:MAG: tRNA1(Val) (adenine(37)-N6)-methyltransferase [Desulfobacteraceae bacterium]